MALDTQEGRNAAMDDFSTRREADTTIDEFFKCELRIGTIRDARPNPKAKKPAYILLIDFGDPLGIKTSSAQLVDNYLPEQLVGSQVAAVVNFPPRNIAGVRSEVLVLGGMTDGGVILLSPTKPVTDGTRIG